MAAVAANKGIQVDKLEAQVDAVTDVTEGGQRTRFSSTIGLGQGLTGREIKILFNSARRCEVHKLLGGQIEFEERLATRVTQLGAEPSVERCPESVEG